MSQFGEYNTSLKLLFLFFKNLKLFVQVEGRANIGTTLSYCFFGQDGSLSLTHDIFYAFMHNLQSEGKLKLLVVKSDIFTHVKIKFWSWNLTPLLEATWKSQNWNLPKCSSDTPMYGTWKAS